jgi:4-hydroxythreonine-4-phosphate dehydrogenase
MKPQVAISLGDPAGIGPEIALKAALDPRVGAICRPLLVGDPKVLARHAEASGLHPTLRLFTNARDIPTVAAGEIPVLALDQFSDQPLRMGEINAANGNARSMPPASRSRRRWPVRSTR